MSVRILEGDCREQMRNLPDGIAQVCVTSPPYFALRDYGVTGQLGLERTPDEYVERMVEVFREVRRLLKDDGTLFLNLGDSYASSWPCNRRSTIGAGSLTNGKREARPPRMGAGLKDKDLIGIPWMVAFALRADGWYLRQCNIWAKPNGMPESVRDRSTSSHEYVFHLAKSERYFYDADAARTPAIPTNETRLAQPDENRSTLTGAPHGRHVLGAAIPEKQRRSDKQRGHGRVHAGFNDRWDAMEKEEQQAGGSNLRSVWWLSPAQFREAHFAVMPPKLAEICITAGSRKGDTVIDPFGGAGTTGLVADRLVRNAVLIELNPEYARLARERIAKDAGLFTDVA